jgi:hypothetical protein
MLLLTWLYVLDRKIKSRAGVARQTGEGRRSGAADRLVLVQYRDGAGGSRR